MFRQLMTGLVTLVQASATVLQANCTVSQLEATVVGYGVVSCPTEILHSNVLGKERAELITGVVRARARGHRCASITTKGHSPDTR